MKRKIIITIIILIIVILIGVLCIYKLNERKNNEAVEASYKDNQEQLEASIEEEIVEEPATLEITHTTGTYGKSGALINGVAGGSELEYLQFGDGPNVFFATFCVHGYEDSWAKDGEVLVNIANDFYNRLIQDMDESIAQKWTIYIFREVNPDGRRLGTTKNGEGRTTLYSKAGRGVDLNRCWPTESSYITYTSARNYNGTAPLQAYEAEALANFLLEHKSTEGKTILVDLHGWENQLLGNSEVCKYYKQQYTTCATRNYGNYGTQFLIKWAYQKLNAKSALVELPYASNNTQVSNMGLSNKYINATLNMLRGI